MGKFKLLKVYRALLWVVAIIFVALGILAALPILRAEYRLKWIVSDFLVTLFPFLMIALGAGIVAEVISLLLSMEDNISKLTAALTPSETPTNTLNNDHTQILEGIMTATAVRARKVNLYPSPTASKGPLTIDRGHVMKVFGRTEDGRWLSVHQSGRLWGLSEDFSLSGDISALPIVQPPTS
ncbi:MAG: hypothetical protein U0452_04900 [Anaerolineae bacterium]